MKKQSVLLLAAIIVISISAQAQIEGTQYFMNSLPQIVNNNPAFMPKYKFALGLPGSMMSVGYYNSGFNYNDFTKRENGERVADFTNFASVLPKKTYVTTVAQFDLFRLGLRIGSSAYLSLNSTVRGYGRAMIPKDAISLVVNGNAAYVGRTASISPELEMTSFWENSVGLAVSPTENLTVGARVKILRGFVNAHTETANATISVADNYAITLAADMNVQTSGVKNFDDGFSLSSYSGNTGFGVDLGATYKLFEKLTLAASIVDIGVIKWKGNTNQYVLDKSKANYTFAGVNVDELMGGDPDYSTQLADSIKTNFDPEERAGSPYTTMLPSKVFASASYEVMKNFSVGGVIYAEQFMGRMSTGWTLGMNKHFGKIMSTSFTYTMSNRSYNNLGAGLSLNLTPVQIYVVGDNLLRLPLSTAIHRNANEFINSTQVFNLRMGVNFVWGWTNDEKKVEGKSYNSKRKGVKTSSDKNKHPKSDQINIRKKR